MKINKIIVSIVLLFLLSSFNSFAGEWLKMGTMGHCTYYIYSDIIDDPTDEYRYKAWYKTTYNTEEGRLQAMINNSLDQEPVESTELWFFSDEWDKMGLKQATYYSSEGEAFYTEKYEYYFEMLNVIPESLGGEMRRCAKALYEHPHEN
jgi:hypothetical protein